jgi:Zn-dependent M16 (insulinase) family peptidase
MISAMPCSTTCASHHHSLLLRWPALTVVAQILYPNTGYARNSGGHTQDIARLTNAVVRDYHARVYRPANLVLVVLGMAPLAPLLATVAAADLVWCGVRAALVWRTGR